MDDQLTPNLRTNLPFSQGAPSTARSALRLFTRELSANVEDVALLLVSELVANAVQHGEPDITLGLWLQPDWLTISVDDAGKLPTSLMTGFPPHEHEHGRGLALVNALAAHWGIEGDDGGQGKHIWFDLARPAASSSAAF
jgi:anti-sigma regulatory factor (Ser/Thr protein kinase)